MTNVISLRILRPRSEYLCLISRYHSQIVGAAEVTANSFFRKCIVLPPKNEATDRLTEIRPVLMGRTDSSWFYNDSTTSLITTHLSFELPSISGTKLVVRRITIGGSFYGSETSGYLEAEAEVKIQTIIILDVTECKIKVTVQSECKKQRMPQKCSNTRPGVYCAEVCNSPSDINSFQMSRCKGIPVDARGQHRAVMVDT